MEPRTYVLSGALPVQDDVDAEQLDRVSRHLGGIATVHLTHDEVAHAVSLRISGTMLRDDVRVIERRIEKFAEEYASTAAILLSEWNGLTSWLVVGMNWQAQCLIKLGAVQEQFSRLAERDLDFLVRLEPSGSAGHGSPLMCVSVETDDRRTSW
jgi:hypothetical protein